MRRASPVESKPIPVRAGIGLRAPHVARVLAERPPVAWFEVHSENYFAAGGAAHDALERIRGNYPLSFHGVGLSLGSADRLDRAHLRRLRSLVERYQPALVSEHLSWGAVGGEHFNDLLPLPYTKEAVDLLVDRIHEVEEALARPILVENVSSYLRFHAELTEAEFVGEVVRRAGCGLLLDVNNVYVNSVNHGFDPLSYLRELPGEAIGEIHLAGHTRKTGLAEPLIIDSHDDHVCPEVWALFGQAIARFGARPTLIEWDANIPSLEVLIEEAAQATDRMEVRRAESA
ncbi:MAG: DUF692 domain-containing protein [Gammaproteobacteria bacterium]|nr:DUF692 domain-containing protein [Gammaproteobacteria bacterium]